MFKKKNEIYKLPRLSQHINTETFILQHRKNGHKLFDIFLNNKGTQDYVISDYVSMRSHFQVI